jgi:hypothetical protein
MSKIERNAPRSEVMLGSRRWLGFPAVAIDVYTGTATVALPDGAHEELARRLAEFGAPDAAERLRTLGSIRHEDKAVVREVLGRWLRSIGPERFGDELTELRDRLGQDIERDWATKTR